MVDVTDAYLRLTPEQRQALTTDSYSSDDLVNDEQKEGHSGPFYVLISEDAIEAFHAPAGPDEVPLAAEPHPTAQEAPVTVMTIRVDDLRNVRIATDGTGNVALESNLLDEDEQASWEVDTKEAISATIFDYEYGEDEERPSEETCNALGEQIRDEIVYDPYKTGVDAIESFLMALAGEGMDLNDGRFGAALFTALETLANNVD